MTAASQVPSDGPGEAADLSCAIESYRRLATMDPPAMRSLVAELDRISRESAASAVQQATADAAARADRHARRAAAARAVLAWLEAGDRSEGST
jgi:hypothetical protein